MTFCVNPGLTGQVCYVESVRFLPILKTRSHESDTAIDLKEPAFQAFRPSTTSIR